MALTEVRDPIARRRPDEWTPARRAMAAASHPAGRPLVNPHAALFAAASEGFRRASLAAERASARAALGAR